MRLVCISDTHNQLDKVKIPSGDILIHSGDLTYNGTLKEIHKFRFDMRPLVKKFKHVLVCAGNHDWLFETDPSLGKLLMKESRITYLEDSSVTIDGINFYGSPHSLFFCSWAFNKYEPELERIYNKIPLDTDVLFTHTPAYGILDENEVGTHCGSVSLLNRIKELNPLLHINGHLHESYGQTIIGPTTFINAAICDVDYTPVNKPIVIDIIDGKVTIIK